MEVIREPGNFLIRLHTKGKGEDKRYRYWVSFTNRGIFTRCNKVNINLWACLFLPRAKWYPRNYRGFFVGPFEVIWRS